MFETHIGQRLIQRLVFSFVRDAVVDRHDHPRVGAKGDHRPHAADIDIDLLVKCCVVVAGQILPAF